MDLPLFDYANWPYSPRTGYQDPKNNKYLTRSLFVETCHNHQIEKARYMLGEHDLYIPAREETLPSAWLIYIHADDEYDAMRKLVGNPHQWEALKNTEWFPKWLDQWEAERKMKVASELRTNLSSIVRRGEGGATAAAKLIMDLDSLKTAPVAKGRPRKETIDPGPGEDEVEKDAQRLRLIGGKGGE